MTLANFMTFFFILSGIILVMLINEEKLLEFENEYDRRKAKQKAQTHNTHGKTR